MSRIGKMPISIPNGVSVEIEGTLVKVSGPKGQLSQEILPEISVKLEDNQVVVAIARPTKQTAALWGLSRTLVANMIAGVSEGFTKNLEMAGVGHRASMQGSKLQLSVGFSHPVLMTPPQGITYAVAENTKISISGIDKQLVGESAAKIRAVKPPEPYKGKGIRYAGEVIRRKAGKAAKAVGK